MAKKSQQEGLEQQKELQKQERAKERKRKAEEDLRIQAALDKQAEDFKLGQLADWLKTPELKRQKKRDSVALVDAVAKHLTPAKIRDLNKSLGLGLKGIDRSTDKEEVSKMLLKKVKL